MSSCLKILIVWALLSPKTDIRPWGDELFLMTSFVYFSFFLIFRFIDIDQILYNRIYLLSVNQVRGGIPQGRSFEISTFFFSLYGSRNKLFFLIFIYIKCRVCLWSQVFAEKIKQAPQSSNLTAKYI